MEEPADEAAVVEAVGRARAVGRRVRAVGSGHSFSDIGLTAGHLLSLRRMAGVVESDVGTGLVRVQAGMTLRALGEELALLGLALENQGDIDAQALAGAVSTATHGTGGRFPNLSGQVLGVRLVTAEGAVVELSNDVDRDAFLAARVGLGALGAITELTLRCVPLYTLRRVDEPRPLARTLAQLDELVDRNDHFELFVFPYTDIALTRTSERSDRAPEPEDPRRAWLRETVLENRVLDLCCRAGRLVPAAVPRINRALAGALGPAVKCDRAHRVYSTRRDVRFTEMEYALPRAAAAVCVERIMDLVERHRLPVGFPLELRFVAADDALLSPSHARESAYVAVHMYRGVEFESFFRGVEAIARDYGGRPHWGKRHYQSAATLRELYPEWDRFQAVRARLDPTGVFANEYTERVLGPVGAASGA
jgi:FAD-linked oxidoreductase